MPAQDGERVRLSIDAVTEGGASTNVVAELGPAHGRVTMALGAPRFGAGRARHQRRRLGVATLLEVARSFAGKPPGRLRLAFWGAEEEGLIGSRHYVRGLSPGEREAIAAYVNLGGGLWALATVLKWFPAPLWLILPPRARLWGLIWMAVAGILALATWPHSSRSRPR